MVNRVEIKDANLRDLSYIMAHMRPGDRAEVMCQFPEGTKTYELAYGLLHTKHAYVAYLDGKPVAAFGVAEMNVVTVSVWAVGTPRMKRAVPMITRFFRDLLTPQLIKEGYRTMEARSHAVHLEAHRWMTATGAVQADLPYIYGRNGEKFITFRWTSDDYPTKA